MKRHLIMVGIYAILTTSTVKAATCEQIDQAISANEDFVEVALAIDDLPLPPALATIKTKLSAVNAALNAKTRSASGAGFAAIESQIQSNNLPMAAVAAMENYKLLIEAFANRLPTTLDTAMLDYAGFKLLGLTAAQQLDWPAMIETAALSNASWAKTRVLIKNQGVIDLVDSAHVGLNASIKAKDSPWLASSAQILLDSVDLIEKESRNTAKTACK
jgi:hypothetical protein